MTVNGPLRVLFFGSDQFSSVSLQALHKLCTRSNQPKLIESLQLVSRPPKWRGKNKSILSTPPIIDYNKSISLPSPIYCDNRDELITKLLPLIESKQFNALICVSFGLLIPGQLINKCSLSLNVHPSLLPKYRGSSPVQYTLLNRDQFTGVTVQSLHPSKFDKGDIIAQTQELEVNKLIKASSVMQGNRTEMLTQGLAKIGADLLTEVIEKRLYLQENPVTNNYESSLAPQIKTSDKLIIWERYDSAQVVNRLSVLGPLYTFINCPSKKPGKSDLTKRVIIHECNNAYDPSVTVFGQPSTFKINDHGDMFVQCHNGTILQVKKIQLEGFTTQTPSELLTTLNKLTNSNVTHQFQ